MSRLIRRLFLWRMRHRYPDQAWYWTEEWQEGERQADADIAAGRTRTFDDYDALERWLKEAE